MIKEIVLIILAVALLTPPATAVISEHVYSIEMSQGLDYQYPDDDLIYECTFRVHTDASIALVEFLTPTGNTFEIPKLPKQWFSNGYTSYEYDGSTAHWEYWAYFSDESGLEDYGDGTYTITVFYEGGGQDQTTAWFGIPRTYDYMPQPTQEPILIFPPHDGTTTSRVTFEWEPCEDTSANLIVLNLENSQTGEEVLKWFPPKTNTWENVELSPGPWEVDLSFGQRYESVPNDDDVDVRVSKYSESDYQFTVRGDVLWPLQVGEVWEFTVTDSREPGTPWTRNIHILETVDIDGSDYYHLGEYDYKTNQWETGVVYVNSDDECVYLWDEGVYKVWPLIEMDPEHVVVPYGEFDAYYYDEGDWYNYFVPGVGHIKWIQFELTYDPELTYTVTVELVDIHIPTLGDFCGANSDQPDRYVDYWDLLYFAQRWHSSPSDTNWDSRCDLAKEDNYVDYWDLLVFAQQWHKGEPP